MEAIATITGRGEQGVRVRGLDAAGCVAAEETAIIVLEPGERNRAPEPIALVALPAPDCAAAADAGADAAAPPSDGGAPGEDGRDAAGEADAAGDLTAADGTVERPSADMAPPPRACGTIADCPTGSNCSGGVCRAAPGTCAEIKTADPAAPDGIYWLRTVARTERVYCDMITRRVLCAETAAEQQGVTRDGGNTPFRLSAALDATAGTCRIWAVRHRDDGYPFGRLNAPNPAQGITCRTLGFRDDDSNVTRRCAYGNDSGFTNCGFAAARMLVYYKWGNSCAMCNEGGGRPTRYVRQGIISQSYIPWTFDGSVSATCKVR